MISLETAGPDAFEPLLSQPFDLVLRDGAAQLELIEVKRLGHKRPEATRDPFSITFRGKSGWRIPQGIHRFQHEATGPLEIFITQIGDGTDGSLFEAVFT